MPGIHPSVILSLEGVTMAGTFKFNQQVSSFSQFQLPELSDKRLQLNAWVFHAPCWYDIFLGHDTLKFFCIALDFNTNTVKTPGMTAPMRSFPIIFTTAADLALDLQFNFINPYIPSSFNDKAFLASDKTILEANYKPVDLKEIVSN